MYFRKTKRIISILLIAVFCTMGIVPSAFASIAAKVNSSSARAYSAISPTAKSVSVPKNLSVSITAMAYGWAQINYKGVTAYMPVKHLTPTCKVPAYTKGATEVYSTTGAKLGTVPMGTAMYALGTIGNYYCVANSSGTVGYVKAGTLTNQNPKTVAAAALAKAVMSLSKVDRAILVGQTMLGRKYELASDPPSSFNCSSFVQYCMGKAGYSMKNTAATQAMDGRYRLIIGVSNIKKGDVLFFATSGNGKVDHSAIYLGGGKFIEASQKAGKVQINTLTDWYKRHLVCARRPG